GRHAPGSTLLPYTTLFRSGRGLKSDCASTNSTVTMCSFLGSTIRLTLDGGREERANPPIDALNETCRGQKKRASGIPVESLLSRPEEHTSELQSREKLVCR